MTKTEKPLEGRRIVVTRAGEQSSELAASLEAMGAEVLALPLLRFAPAADPAPLDRALRELESYDWLFLTSQNAVRFLAERAREAGLDLAKAFAGERARPQVAAVGKATADAARERGWRVARVSGGRGGADLVREMGPEITGCRVLLPRSDRATGELGRALEEQGARPVEVVAYRTLPAGPTDGAVVAAIERGEVDAVSFASPSAFLELVAQVGGERFRRLAAATVLAAIGPTTASAIRRSGYEAGIEAKVSSGAGLAAAIAAHFSGNPVASGGQA